MPLAPAQPDQPSDPTLDPAMIPAASRRIVAIGASAGGLQALSTLLAALPADFPAPVLIVLHLSPDFPSRLAEILGRRTLLSVRQAQDGDHIHAGWVYVAPPGRHLLACAGETLSLTTAAKVHHCRPSVDVLFESLAACAGAMAVGVVLTGGDGDGADGVRAIRAAGGVTFAQDEPSSEQPSMPRSAAETGAVDYVLPLEAIAPALVTLLTKSTPHGKARYDETQSASAEPELGSTSEILTVPLR